MKQTNKLTYNETTYRSQGELRIAKFLTEVGIDFEYEFPIAVKHNNKISIWYPDFYLKEFQIVIEFFGMVGDQNYDKGTKKKKETYKQCGIEYIGIYPKESNNKIFDILYDISNLFYDKRKKIKRIIEENKK